MENIIVNIVRGASGWKGQGAKRIPQGVPGVLNFTAIYYTLATLAYRGRSWAALGVCVWPLRTSPGSSRRHFRDVLGPLGELWEHFLGAFLE